MNRIQWFFLALFFTVSYSFGQQFSEAIEDNSFLIEEAYNQDPRVVQHISNAYYQKENRSFIYTFTQEWPVGGQTNQLSYAIPYQSIGSSISGLGDVLINYRYQVWDDKNWGWVAPRFSIILPTGESSAGLGNGVVGFQTSLAVSKRWTNEFISHFNLGFTLLPNVEGSKNPSVEGPVFRIKRTLPSYLIGTSGIWLLSENFNFMCEALYTLNSAINGSGDVKYSSQTIISPGIRIAINLGSLQIVPGLALPITFDSGGANINLYGYLSFEHPF
jgi:hypothetical protein